MRSIRLRHTLWTLPALAAGIIGCGGDQGPIQPVPTKLVFTVQPTNATAGVAIASAVQVAIQDASGNTVTSATAAVTVTLGTNPGGGTLLGTKTVNAGAGVASFGDLVIERAASGYTLVASSGALTGATSVPFAIAPAAKTTLAVVVQPSAAAGAEPITPAVQVAVQDAFGNTVTAATDAVTVALAANPGAGTLSGTLTVAATQGIATFSNLRIDRPGSGYTLAASAGGLNGATSVPFAVTLTFAAVSTSYYHTCGLTTAGAAYCWGDNSNGQLGDGTTTNRLTPGLVTGGVSFAAVSAGRYHTCGVTAAGAAYCWGTNGNGQLGDGTSGDIRSSPGLVAGGVSFGGVSAGAFHTCGVTAVGAAYCWGYNGQGRLGDGTETDHFTPGLVAGGVSFAAVSAGGGYTCGVTTAGAAYCWGFNIYGALGDGTTTTRLSPGLVAGGVTFAAVSAGGGHTCGITAAGAAYCWGENSNGQLGDGTTINRLTPVRVVQ